MSRLKIKRVVLCGILMAVALTIFVLEAQLPPITPIPGIKLGLANIVTLFALAFLSPKEAFLILFGRVVLGAIFAGAPSTLLYSLPGGIFCLLVEMMLIKCFGTKFIWGISVVGAVVHNLTQLAVASMVTKTSEIFWYAPPLLLSGAVTGLLTGFAVWYLCERFGERIRHLIK